MANGLSPQKKLDNIQKKAADERKYMAKTTSLIGGGVVGAVTAAVVTTKFPRSKSVLVDATTGEGKIPTLPIAAVGLTLVGMANRNYGLMGAGMSIGGHWIGDWVSQQEWAQPT
jgi:hypothetical protein